MKLTSGAALDAPSPYPLHCPAAQLIVYALISSRLFRSILAVLPLVVIALGVALGTGQWPSTEDAGSGQVRATDLGTEGAHPDETAYVVHRSRAPSLFMQPAPVIVPVQRDSESERILISGAASAEMSALPASAHVSSAIPVSETAGLATEGRSRHQLLQTYRC